MRITSFKQYLHEKNEVYFTFGRMNPPTIGHGKLFDVLKEEAGKHPYKIFMSHVQDSNKNPLLYEDKLKFSRKLFPRHGRHIIESSVKNILEVASKLYEDGYKKINMVVGEDRKYEFETLLNKYNGVKGKTYGFYVFESINVISAGSRNNKASDITGVSSSKLREAVKHSNFMSFSQGLPKSINTSDAKKIYNMVRSGMGLNEETSFKTHKKLETVSDVREKYIKGELFFQGDSVVIKETGEIGDIKILGSNYVIIEGADGKRYRKWLTAVEKLN